MISRLRYALSILLLVGVLSPASAATPSDTVDAITPEAVTQAELARSLTSDSVHDRVRAARRIRTYAYTDRYSRAFFRPLRSPLHDIAADGRTELLRILAISALAAIGSDAAVRTLKAQVVSFDPGPVRQVTVHVIAQHDASWAVAEASALRQ
jgi:hypothetical protein